MYAIDQITRKLKNLVLKDGTDRLLVDVAGATLTTGNITLDMSSTNAKLDDIKAQIATNTGRIP
jgi:hypothetical protein